MNARPITRRQAVQLLGMMSLGLGQELLVPKGLRLKMPESLPSPSDLIHHMSSPRTGDMHPFYHDGTWYVYYLIPDSFQARLVTSTDLLTWREVPLTFTDPTNPDASPYFVLNVFNDPLNNVFRTYHGWSGNRMISNASTNLTEWSPSPEFTVPSQMIFNSQRDPYVFWNEDEAAYWCIMTCKVSGKLAGSNGAVGFASSPDLRTWQGRGKLFYPGNIGEPEVPQQFKLGDQWYLLASILGQNVGKPSYWVSDMATGPWAAQTPDSLDGAHVRAANVGFAPDRILLFGWIPLTENTWGGHIAFPREVYALADGRLGTRLAAEIGTSVRGEKLFPAPQVRSIPTPAAAWSLDGQSAAFDGSESYGQVEFTPLSGANLPGDASRFDLEFDVLLDRARLAGARLDSSDGTVGTDIILDRADLRLHIKDKTGGASDDAALGPLPEAWFSGVHHFRVIVEGNIVELFVDDTYSLAARLSDRRGLRAGTTVMLFAYEGSSRFDEIAIYRLKSRADLKLL